MTTIGIVISEQTKMFANSRDEMRLQQSTR